MADQDHFLEQTLRLHDPALGRALSIYRESGARTMLVEMARGAGASERKRVAVPLGPESSPAWVLLEPDGEVVTCLAAGMCAVGAHAVPWSVVEAALQQLKTLAGGDPDPYWTWRRLVHDLLHAGGWLSREAYRILVRENLLLRRHMLRLCRQAVEEVHKWYAEHKDVVHVRADRQPPWFRREMDRLTWHLRHLLHLAGDVDGALKDEQLCLFTHHHFGHIDVAAGVALGRVAPTAFALLEREFVGQTKIGKRAGIVRSLALIAARQPDKAAAAGRFLRRLEERTDPKDTDPWGNGLLRRTGRVALYYLAAQGGRVGAETVAAFHGRPEPEKVRQYAWLFEHACGEVHLRWPPPAWRPEEYYLPWEQAQAERQRGPRECPEPLWEAADGFEMRVAPKVGRNDPCACGSGRKAKRCCGTAGKFDKFRSCGLPPPHDAEERAIRRADDLLKGREANETAQDRPSSP